MNILNTPYFMRTNFFKSFILFLLAISNPLYSINKIMFLFESILFFIIILIILIYSDYSSSKKNYNNLSDWALYRLFTPWFQVVLILVVITILMIWLSTTQYNNSIILIVCFCWLFSLITVVYVFRNIYSLLKKIKEVVQEQSLFNKGILSLSFLTLLFTFVAPDIAFAFGYNLFLSVFKGVKLGFLDSYYLSLIISNTLPVGKTFTNYISDIGDNPYIYTFQIFHVFTNKIVNWVIIGVIFNYLFLAFDGKKHQSHS